MTDENNPHALAEQIADVVLERRIQARPTAELLDERGKTHGRFEDHAAVTQYLKQAMQTGVNWDKLSPTQREALEMIQHKVGRILAGDPAHADHWDDIAGYATLGKKG